MGSRSVSDVDQMARIADHKSEESKPATLRSFLNAIAAAYRALATANFAPDWTTD